MDEWDVVLGFDVVVEVCFFMFGAVVFPVFAEFSWVFDGVVSWDGFDGGGGEEAMGVEDVVVEEAMGGEGGAELIKGIFGVADPQGMGGHKIVEGNIFSNLAEVVAGDVFFNVGSEDHVVCEVGGEEGFEVSGGSEWVDKVIEDPFGLDCDGVKS